MRSKIVLGIALAVGLGLSGPAAASDGRAVAATAAGSVLGEVGGAAALGLAGLGVGASMCSPNAMECWAPLIGAGLGASGGAVGGGIGGAAIGAKLGGGRPGRAALGATIGAGAGVGLLVAGFAIESPNAGLVGMALAIPAGAAIAVGTDRRPPRSDEAVRPSVSIAPAFGPRFRGAVVSGRF